MRVTIIEFFFFKYFPFSGVGERKKNSAAANVDVLGMILYSAIKA